MMLRLLAVVIVLSSLLARAYAQDQGTAVFRTGVSDVRVVVQVTENNKLITDLKQEDFIIKDEAAEQKIAYFNFESEPLTLLLLLDISGSMKEHIIEMSDAALESLKHLSPGDRIGIMTFGSRANMHFDFFDNHAEVARQLRTATDDQDKDGFGTAINAAVIEAAKALMKDPATGRKSMLIVTDNLGINHRANDELATGYLLRADAPLNAMVVGRAIRPGTNKMEDPDDTPADVFKLAEATGGEAVKSERAAARFADMIARIRDRYTLAYHAPEGAKAGSFRSITVTLTPAALRLHPGALLRYRSGYFVRE